MPSIEFLTGDCREVLRTLPGESVHCVVTSPPYFGLRDYGVAGQIGLEPTPEAYVAEIVAVFREVRRVLRKDGTCWLNLGDSYAGGGNGKAGSFAADRANWREVPTWSGQRAAVHGLKPKDLIGIPWMVAFALRADGWWLRQDIIWSKPNPMPESVTDRCTKAHEYLFLLTKSERYYFDQEAIAEAVTGSTVERLSQPNLEQQEGSYRVPGKTNGPMKAVGRGGKNAFRGQGHEREGENGPANRGGRDMREVGVGLTRNRRSVWTVATQPFAGPHFATMPPALAEPCILAGCPAKCCAKCGAPWVRETERVDQGYNGSRYGERAVGASGGAITGGTAKSTLGSSNGKLTGIRETIGFSPSCSCDAGTVAGTVIDPFAGSGTTGLVARNLERNAILIDLNPANIAMAKDRVNGTLFAEAGA